MANPTDWKEKCLRALDQQEALEEHVSSQSDLLRRLAMYLGTAALGLDPELDAAMSTLKDALKGAEYSEVNERMQRLERIVLQLEDKRQNCHRQSVQSIVSIISLLTQLSLPGDLLRQLNAFTRQLENLDSTASLIPEQINTLAHLHDQVIAASKEPEQSLWQRVRGGQRLKFDQKEVGDELSLEGNHDEVVAAGAVEQKIGTVEQHLDQPGWDAVAEEINVVLDDVLATFKTDEQTSLKWQSAKMRIQDNMDWHQLVETLEDLRDLLGERAERVDHGISDYLTQVNEELHEICERLGVSIEEEHKQEVAVDELGVAVKEQMQQMQSMVASSTNLEGLKQDISQHITVIGDALSEFREKSAQSRPISEELQALIQKVQTIESESERTRRLLAQEQHRASHDALTELPNRNSYNSRVLQEWHRFKRYGRPLCIAVCDIDHFKRFNDDYGHQIGDRVLRLIAKSLQKRLRSVDFVARYGGEEFVILLPETSLDNAFKVLESARSAIGGAAFRFKDEPVNLTFSCGVTEFSKEDTAESAFARADKGLYSAKEQGRNKTIRVDVENLN